MATEEKSMDPISVLATQYRSHKDEAERRTALKVSTARKFPKVTKPAAGSSSAFMASYETNLNCPHLRTVREISNIVISRLWEFLSKSSLSTLFLNHP
ncbi:hypothetical protein CEXT_246621 [Caerostris extrusa]|uniref:Uncharacterized protein n=1 Tax=Caerostris extrusa TaxID=172846 RepID=A0AAV4NYD9_CAEEX|nr:hypothetical protein CEXT_246621 [Caerostris extrusa]